MTLLLKILLNSTLGGRGGLGLYQILFLGLQSPLSVLSIPSTHCIGGDVVGEGKSDVVGDGNGDQVGDGDVVWRW